MTGYRCIELRITVIPAYIKNRFSQFIAAETTVDITHIKWLRAVFFLSGINEEYIYAVHFK